MLKQKAQEALRLKEQYSRAYEDDFDLGRKLELQYLQLRAEILDSVDSDIKRQKSISIKEVKRRVLAMPKKPKRATGIYSLDTELVTEKQRTFGEKGGFSLGNYIQIAGSKGAGKTSFMLKILTSLSNFERVCWMDFEMGERRVTEKLEDFTHDEDNLLYYNSSRELNDVIEEIKFLNASGVNHFVIDSTMKLHSKDAKDAYDKFSSISRELSAVTSTLGINIYIINQMSQQSERDGALMLKGGNDAEYDADYIFYILKMKKMNGDKNVKDDLGFDVYDEDMRVIKCTKNREDDRTFSVVINKTEVFSNPEETIYDMGKTA